MNITWHSAAPERFRLTVFKEGQPLQDPIGPGPWVGAWLWIYSPHTREDEAGWVRAAHGFRRNGKVELRSPVGLLATIEDASGFVEVEDMAPFADAARAEPLERVEGLGSIPFIGDFFAAPVPGGLLPRSSYAQMALDNAALYTEQERHDLYARGMELQPSDEPLNQFVAASIVPSRTLKYRSDRPYRTGRSTVPDVIDQWDTPSQAPFPLNECAADCEEFAQIAFQTAVKLGPPEGYEACLAVVVLSDGTQNVMHAMAMCVDRTWLNAHWDNPDNMDAAKLPHVPLDGVEHARAIPTPEELPTHVHYPFLVALLRADGLRILMHKDAVAGVPWDNTSVRFVSHCDKEEQQRRRWAGAELVRKYMPAAHAEARAGAGTAGRYNDSVLSVVGKDAGKHLREFHLAAYPTAYAFVRDDARGAFPSRIGVYDAHFVEEVIFGWKMGTDVPGGFDNLRMTLSSLLATDENNSTICVFVRRAKNADEKDKAVVAISVKHWRRGTEAERYAEERKGPDSNLVPQKTVFFDDAFLVFTGVVAPFFVSRREFLDARDLVEGDRKTEGERVSVFYVRYDVGRAVSEAWSAKAREWAELRHEASHRFVDTTSRVGHIEIKDSIGAGVYGYFADARVNAVRDFAARRQLPTTGRSDEPVLQIEVANALRGSGLVNENRRMIVLTTWPFLAPESGSPHQIVITKSSNAEFNPVFFERCLMRIIGSVAGFGGAVVTHATPLGIDRRPDEWSTPTGGLKTYAFMSPSATLRVPDYQSVKRDVTAAVEGTGLVRVDGNNVDVAIVFHVPLSDQLPEFDGVDAGWPVPWQPPTGKYRMLVVVVVRDHTNAVPADWIPYMARGRAELTGKTFDLTGVFVKCVDVSNREARDSAYVAGLVKGLLPVVRSEPDKVVVAQEEKAPAPVASAPAKRSTPARNVIRVAIRVDEHSLSLTKARPYVEHKEDVVTEVFNVLPEESSDLPIVRRESVAKADGVLVFHRAVAEARVEFEHLIAPECDKHRADGAKNLIVIVCRRNEGNTLHSEIKINPETKKLFKGIPIFFIDFKLVRPGDEIYLHPANGPRYKQIADAIQTWRGAPRAVVDASPAAEVVQRPPVRVEPPVVQRAPPPAQRAPSPVLSAAPVVDQPVVAPEPVQPMGAVIGASAAAQPDVHAQPAQQLAPVQAAVPVVGRPPVGKEIVYAIVNDPTEGMVKRGIVRRITGEQRIPTHESHGEQTDFLIVFAEKKESSWDNVRQELLWAMGEWNWRHIMLVVVHAGDEKDPGDLPGNISDAMDFTGDLLLKGRAIRDQGSFDGLLDRMAMWIVLTSRDAASADDASIEFVPLPDDGRPVVRTATPSPEPDNGRPYSPSPSDPDNGPLATYGDTDSDAELQQLVDEAERLIGAPNPPVVPRTAPRARPRAASLGSLRAPLRPPVVPVPAAPAALAPIAEYDPFDDAYDGGHAAHMHYSAMGRALAARLSAE